ncbi:MAG TPA: RDD family protein, partial [Acidimicrobiales bacterium]|nr:RDD family protein [Acidimicrobiales bacterium]
GAPPTGFRRPGGIVTEPSTDRSGPRASFGRRLLALLLDSILLGVVGAILVFLMGDVAGQGLNVLIGAGYFIALEGSPSGQTVGKRGLGIRVLDLDAGGPVGYGRAVIRYVGRFVSGIVFAVGYLWMLWDGQKQTWHDKMATTVVVPTSAYPVESWPG